MKLGDLPLLQALELTAELRQFPLSLPEGFQERDEAGSRRRLGSRLGARPGIVRMRTFRVPLSGRALRLPHPRGTDRLYQELQLGAWVRRDLFQGSCRNLDAGFLAFGSRYCRLRTAPIPIG